MVAVAAGVDVSGPAAGGRLSGRRLRALKRAFAKQQGRPASATTWEGPKEFGPNRTGSVRFYASEVRKLKKAYNRGSIA